MKTSKITAVAATGDITTATAHLREVVLTGGSDAATAVVKAGGSSGTTILTIKAAIATTVPVVLTDVLCSGGIHVTLTGTAPAFTATYV